MNNTYVKKFSVSSYDLNPKGQARLTTLANFFQEMAYHHANQLGFGYDDMNENQTMWVLSRMRIRVLHYPVWDDQVLVETWHKGMDRLFGLRDFRVTDNSGKVIGFASSAWLILNSQTKRPVRLAEDLLNNNKGIESVFEDTLDKISVPDKMSEVYLKRVVFSDLDVMGHVNNVKYIEWCIDATLTGKNRDCEIREIEINFMREALIGEVISIHGQMETGSESNQVYRYVGIRQDDHTEIFRSRLFID